MYPLKLLYPNPEPTVVVFVVPSLEKLERAYTIPLNLHSVHLLSCFPFLST
jgi:hypothetical protein